MADPKIRYDIEANVAGDAEVGQLASRIEQLAGTLDGDLKASALASADALRQLAQKDGAIQNFVDLKREAQQAATGLQDTQAAAQKLGSELAAVEKPTRAQSGQMQKLRDAVKDAKTEVISSNSAVMQARADLAQYGISTDNLSQSQRNIKAAIASARTEVAAMAPAWQSAAVGAASSAGKQVQSTKEIGDGLKNVVSQLDSAKTAILSFVGAQGLSSSIKDVAALADEWVNMKSRLQLALGAQTDINKAMADVEGVAKRTYSSLDATANLYGKIATAGRDMGVSQQQALSITETINKSIQLSGASAQASESAVTQLIQGLQSGVLRGDEFNSIMEQSPRLAKAMADGIGVPIGSLRGLAEQGKLTSQTVINALQKQSQSIDNEFKTLPLTIGRAVQSVQTEWQKFVGSMDASTGASAGAAAGIEVIAKHLEDLARLAAETGAALTAAFAIQAVQGLRAAAVQMAATGGAAALLRRDLDTLNKPVQIAIAVTGFEAGYQLGSWLRENSVWARQLGVVITEMGATIVNDLQLIEEATAALFTKDTIGKAVDRYWERSQKLTGITKEMFADAEKAPTKVGEATDVASAKTTALATAAQTAGYNIAHAAAQGAAGVAGVGSAAQSARSALEQLAGVINAPKSVDNGITAIVNDLIAAKNRAQDIDHILRMQLPDAIDKLSGPELVKFRSEFISAMDAAKKALQEAIDTKKPQAEIDALQAKIDSFQKSTRTGLGLIAEQAAKNLGVDVPLAFNKMSVEFIAAQSNMSVLIRSLPELKAVGVDTGLAVAQALSKMIDGAKNQAELDAVRQQIGALKKELGDKVSDGLLDQGKQKANELKDALDKAKPGITSLREAMKELGLQSRDELDATAKKAQEAYALIKAKGQEEGESYVAWQARKQDAARAMLERLIAANGGVITEAIKARAAMEGIDLSSEKAGRSMKNAFDSGSDAASRFTQNAGASLEEIARMDEALDAINAKYGQSKAHLNGTYKLDEQTKAKPGQIDLSLATKLLDATNSGRPVDMTASEYAQAREQAKIAYDAVQTGGQNATGLTSLEALRSTEALYRASMNSNAVNITDKPSAGAATQQSSPAKTYNVRITLPDGSSTAINTSSDADAQKLINLLQSAKLSSGL